MTINQLSIQVLQRINPDINNCTNSSILVVILIQKDIGQLVNIKIAQYDGNNIHNKFNDMAQYFQSISIMVKMLEHIGHVKMCTGIVTMDYQRYKIDESTIFNTNPSLSVLQPWKQARFLYDHICTEWQQDKPYIIYNSSILIKIQHVKQTIEGEDEK